MSENIENESKLLPQNWFWNSNIRKFIPDNILDCLEEEIQNKIQNNHFIKGGIGHKHDIREDLDIRDTDIIMFDCMHWFCGILFNIGLASNAQAEWNFGVHSPETLQIAIYRENQHYKWHTDSALLTRDPNIRKITVICMLSNKEEYTGGILELEGTGEMQMNKGDIIAFPSFIPHRVTPVTSGIRKTATLWILGNRSF
jgi:PKHD-type hydroxylase